MKRQTTKPLTQRLRDPKQKRTQSATAEQDQRRIQATRDSLTSLQTGRDLAKAEERDFEAWFALWLELHHPAYCQPLEMHPLDWFRREESRRERGETTLADIRQKALEAWL